MGEKGPNCHLKGLLSDWSQGMKVLLKKKWIFVIKGIILSWFSEAFDWKQGPIWSRLCGSDALKRIIIRLKSGDRSDSLKNKHTFVIRGIIAMLLLDAFVWMCLL